MKDRKIKPAGGLDVTKKSSPLQAYRPDSSSQPVHAKAFSDVADAGRLACDSERRPEKAF